MPARSPQPQQSEQASGAWVASPSPYAITKFDRPPPQPGLCRKGMLRINRPFHGSRVAAARMVKSGPTIVRYPAAGWFDCTSERGCVIFTAIIQDTYKNKKYMARNTGRLAVGQVRSTARPMK